MRRGAFPFFSVLLVFFLFVSCANDQEADQPPVQTISQAAPKIDGVVEKGEYPAAFDVAPFTLSVARSGSNLVVAVSAKASGWIAVGTGSRVMNNAAIFMGNFADGTASFTEQTGRGHGHSDTAQSIVDKYAVLENGGTTTMELTLPASKILSSGQKELSVILAMGAADDFSAGHTVRKQTTVTFE